MTPKTDNVISAFFATAAGRGDVACVHFKRGGAWQTMSWGEVAEAIRGAAAGLRGRGIRHGDRVIICAPTCLEWMIADMAIMATGAITVPIYPSLTPEQMSHILADARPALFLMDSPCADRCREAMQLGGGAPPPQVLLRGDALEGATLAQLIAETSPEERAAIDAIAGGIEGGDVATIVFTSGTMGEQKGAVLTHGNLMAEIRGTQRLFHFGPEEIGLVCLPLAHVLGRLMQIYQLVQGCPSAYAEGIDRLAANYREIRPHFICGVPRMLEKAHELVCQRVAQSSPPLRRLFSWAMGVGRERTTLVQKHRDVPAGLRLRAKIADLLVFRRIRAGMGGRLWCFICGGAPLPEEIARFFHAAGILVLEGWGLTETFAAATVNRVDDYHFGTVGKPVPGVEIAIAPDGEILVRGPTVFKEYFNRPQETQAAFDADGWFLTGDLGELSRDGFIRLTGRKKEIIVTAGGKNIAPQAIEQMLARSPYVNHAVVYGDGHKYLTALVTLNVGAVIDFLSERGCAVVEGEPLSRNDAVRQLIWEHVEELNRRLASYETIKRIAILDREFTVESGELTPTLKIRRAFTSAKYRDVLEALYRE